jgi:hypothetical protein
LNCFLKFIAPIWRRRFFIFRKVKKKGKICASQRVILFGRSAHWALKRINRARRNSHSFFLNVELIIGQSFNNGPCAWIYVTFNLKPGIGHSLKQRRGGTAQRDWRINKSFHRKRMKLVAVCTFFKNNLPFCDVYVLRAT